MNENVKINMINIYLTRYDLKSQEKVIWNKEYFIYKEIFNLIENCRVIATGPKGIII